MDKQYIARANCSVVVLKLAFLARVFMHERHTKPARLVSHRATARLTLKDTSVGVLALVGARRARWHGSKCAKDVQMTVVYIFASHSLA